MADRIVVESTERLPPWATKLLLGALGCLGVLVIVPLLIYAVSGVSELQGDKKAAAEVRQSFEKRLDKFEATLEAVRAAVGAKKP